MIEGFELPHHNPPYSLETFPKIPRQVISMACCILGYQSDEWVDEVILGFFFSPFMW